MSMVVVAPCTWLQHQGQNMNGGDPGSLVIDASCSEVYSLLNFGWECGSSFVRKGENLDLYGETLYFKAWGK